MSVISFQYDENNQGGTSEYKVGNNKLDNFRLNF